MKKLIALVVVFILTLSITSCRSSKFDPTDTSNIYVQIILNNNKKINLRLYRSKAPLTVDNFVGLVQDGFYDNTIFHRVIKDFMIQGGGFEMKAGVLTPKGDLEPIKGEFASNGWTRNDIKHELGVISMARATSKNSATSQFFLCSATTASLDGEYAAFGKTTDSKSNDVIVAVSKVTTYQYSASFTDMPKEIVKIKRIKLSNKTF